MMHLESLPKHRVYTYEVYDDDGSLSVIELLSNTHDVTATLYEKNGRKKIKGYGRSSDETDDTLRFDHLGVFHAV